MHSFLHITTVLLILLSSIKGEEKLESLEEAISVATSKKFGEIFEGGGGSATELLNLFYEKMKIDHEYIKKVFLEAAKVDEVKELDDIHLDVYKAVDLANEVIKHFQANPMAGRKDEL